MRLRMLVFMILATLSSAVSAAAATQKPGGWSVEVQKSGDCLGEMATRDGGKFILLASRGELTFAVQSKSPLRPGKAGALATEAYSFDFEPALSTEDNVIYTVRNLTTREVAALRLARKVRVSVDGVTILEADMVEAGLDEVLDGLAACSNGEAGWWGQGVARAPAEGPAYNAEGVWALEAGKEGQVCIAHALVGEDRQLQVIAVLGQMGLAVGALDGKLPRGRRGKVETDAYSFGFKPDYSSDVYMRLDDPLDSQALFTLRRAKSIRITVDDKLLVEASLEGSGFPELLNSAAACFMGQEGWWGLGARQP
ncbi:MAG: hypothetical protein GC203_20835 [Phenylobacterium sp.]|uniref:hypothetical protein n=1 Tax=Phenylobacterium sp. TaxID=1871053 RepID=UPI0025FD77F4|nr:hypothetical protein [Phenylobacterium sp.]MBI1200312.1 hypothetical protein [Phenylobacterium sp.]